MDIADFVETSLTEILKGIRAAQLKTGGDAIGAEIKGRVDKGWFVSFGKLGDFTIVDFDISVIAENKICGKAGLKVWSVGAEAGAGTSSQHASRVCFSVHVRIHEGARAPDSGFSHPIDYEPAGGI
jgi:hypothetical protein